MQRDRSDAVIGPGKSVLKASVQRAVGIQTRDLTASRSVHGIEMPSDEYFPVRLYGKRVHVTVNRAAQGKGEIKVPIPQRVDSQPGIDAPHTAECISHDDRIQARIGELRVRDDKLVSGSAGNWHAVFPPLVPERRSAAGFDTESRWLVKNHRLALRLVVDCGRGGDGGSDHGVDEHA